MIAVEFYDGVMRLATRCDNLRVVDLNHRLLKFNNEGWETVFEHFGSGGDAFLGGENLLEHLAYRSFCHNIEVCRKNKISFTKPLDAQDFPGSEQFLERTQAAATNSLMLMARLRTFWETGESSNKTGIEKIDLLGAMAKNCRANC